MKFGGTSMAGTERIRRVAQIVRKQAAPKDGGPANEVAVVVSAMAGETDRLVNFAREAHALYDPAEYDVVVASGEQVTSGLLALTLQSLGQKARSWLGWQLPIRTSDGHASARIEDIDTRALGESLLLAAGYSQDHARTITDCVVRAQIDERSLALETFGEAGPPRVTIDVEAIDGPQAVDFEYSVRVDGMPWSSWRGAGATGWE
mgnify:CR=1 FL=1